MQKALLIHIVLLSVSINGPDQGSRSSADVNASFSMNTCPPETEIASTLLQNFLDDDTHSERRIESGLQGIAAADARLLTDATDEAICSALNLEYDPQNMTGRDVTYYEAGNRYIISMPINPPDDAIVAHGWKLITVMDSNLNEIETYAF